MNYDSREEQLFHKRHQNLEYLDAYYTQTFEDCNHETFHAKPDFFDHDLNCFIEFKCYQLNTVKSQEDYDTKWGKQKKYLSPYNYNMSLLKYGWNHSIIKQSIVASTLRANDLNYLLVFKDNTELSTQSKNKMNKLLLPWCYESDLNPPSLSLSERVFDYVEKEKVFILDDMLADPQFKLSELPAIKAELKCLCRPQRLSFERNGNKRPTYLVSIHLDGDSHTDLRNILKAKHA